MAIHFTFTITDTDPNLTYLPKGTWKKYAKYYYNGDTNVITHINNGEETNYIKEMYKAQYNRDLKHYDWSSKAPVWLRIFGVLNPTSSDKNMESVIAGMNEAVKKYQDAYWNPTAFVAQTAIFIRRSPGKNTEILGQTEVGQRFEVLDLTTECDYHWAKVKIPNTETTGWLAMGNIMGDWFGERIR